MIIELFADVFPWTSKENFYASPTVFTAKDPNAIRYKIVFEIPDPKQIDTTITPMTEEVKS